MHRLCNSFYPLPAQIFLRNASFQKKQKGQIKHNLTEKKRINGRKINKTYEDGLYLAFSMLLQ